MGDLFLSFEKSKNYIKCANLLIYLHARLSERKISKNDIQYCLDALASGFSPC